MFQARALDPGFRAAVGRQAAERRAFFGGTISKAGGGVAASAGTLGGLGAGQGPGGALWPRELSEAVARAQGRELAAGQSIAFDPYMLVDQLGYKERASSLSYDLLRSLIWQVPAVAAIIQVRLNQVASFARPAKSRHDIGMRVAMRDFEAHPTAADKKEMRRLTDWMMTTGSTSDPRGRDDLVTFTKKYMKDSLELDQGCMEVVPDRRGKPAQFYAVDSATIRLADTYRLHPADADPDRVKTVQVFDSAVIAEFTPAEMAFGVRNPRSDLRGLGYGVSELEYAVAVITDFLYGTNHNRKFFSQGADVEGVMAIMDENLSEEALQNFRRDFQQMVVGPSNARRTPILKAQKGLSWIPFGKSNKDMEFGAWIDFLLKLLCAVFLIDPIEIGFKYGAQGQKSVFDSANRSKIVESRDKGLRPLLVYLATVLDRWLIWPQNPEFCLEYCGLSSMTAKEQADLKTQQVRTIRTLNEMRAEDDWGPVPNGDGPLDSVWAGRMKADADREEARKIRSEQREHEMALAEKTAAAQATMAKEASAARDHAAEARDRGVARGPKVPTAGVGAVRKAEDLGVSRLPAWGRKSRVEGSYELRL